jgi:hypothetical protein
MHTEDTKTYTAYCKEKRVRKPETLNSKFYDVKQSTSRKIFPVENMRIFIILATFQSFYKHFGDKRHNCRYIIAQDVRRDFQKM